MANYSSIAAYRYQRYRNGYNKSEGYFNNRRTSAKRTFGMYKNVAKNNSFVSVGLLILAALVGFVFYKAKISANVPK